MRDQYESLTIEEIGTAVEVVLQIFGILILDNPITGDRWSCWNNSKLEE